MLRDFHMRFERRLYSAPFALVGQRIRLRATTDVVTTQPVAVYASNCRLCERCSITDQRPPGAHDVTLPQPR